MSRRIDGNPTGFENGTLDAIPIGQTLRDITGRFKNSMYFLEHSARAGGMFKRLLGSSKRLVPQLDI